MTTMTSDRPAVAPDVSRSWLLVPAMRATRFDTADRSVADQIILDLEDGVAVDDKDRARAAVIDRLRNGASAWVRINDHASRHWHTDLGQLAEVPGLRGVMLPKVETVAEVEDTVARLDPGTPVIAMLESALGIENAVVIACTTGLFRLAFGSGDYRRDVGVGSDDVALVYPRSRIVVASRIGGLPGPIDGPTVSADPAVLREQTGTAVALGLTGRLCLNATQAATVNATMSPKHADVVWAKDFLDAFDRRDRIIQDGSDLPLLGRAQRIVRLADAFGLS